MFFTGYSVLPMVHWKQIVAPIQIKKLKLKILMDYIYISKFGNSFQNFLIIKFNND